VPGAVARARPHITTVALIRGAGMLPKHARDRFSPTITLRETSMPVPKHSSYARSRSRQSRQIDGASFTYLRLSHDETRALPQRASSPQPATVADAVGFRSIVKIVVQLVDSAGDILLAIASCIVMETLAGCAAYAIAMYGIPKAGNDGEFCDPEPFEPAVHPKPASRPALRLISADTEARIRPLETFSPPDATQPCANSPRLARSEQTHGAAPAWRHGVRPE
jgi:hypothetical protein